MQIKNSLIPKKNISYYTSILFFLILTFGFRILYICSGCLALGPLFNVINFIKGLIIF